jgi:hypothetical protein
MVLAGGALALGACKGFSSDEIGCGNANPDPCICGRPDESETLRAACDVQTACEADGGTYVGYTEELPDGGTRPPHCIPPYSGPNDSGPEASRDASPDGPAEADADGAPGD